jgi:hypothetical protein
MMSMAEQETVLLAFFAPCIYRKGLFDPTLMS